MQIAITNDLNSIVDPTPLLSILTYFPNVAELVFHNFFKCKLFYFEVLSEWGEQDHIPSRFSEEQIEVESVEIGEQWAEGMEEREHNNINRFQTFPTWAMNLPNLQFLKVSTTTNEKTLIDPSFISKLNLPALEHFIMIG